MEDIQTLTNQELLDLYLKLDEFLKYLNDKIIKEEEATVNE